MRFIFILLFTVLAINGMSSEFSVNTLVRDSLAQEKPMKHARINAFVMRLVENKTDRNVRLIAAGLTITLGVFGAHRLYLGTTPKVPAVYTLTLGGGMGVLPLVDLVLILSTKDLNKFYNNRNIFMWTIPQ